MSARAVLERAVLLQFSLLFLPGLIVTLAIYGSEFGLASGCVVAGLLLWLLVQSHLTRALARRAAGSATAWVVVCAVTAVAASAAYRPLHFGWWDERSVSHALLLAAIGIPSLFLSSCAAERLRAAGEGWTSGLPGALTLCALPWLGAWQHPYFMVLGVALTAALALAAGGSRPPRRARGPESGPSRGVLLWMVALATIDLSLPVWERNLEGGFGPAVALALAAAGLGAALPRARAWLIATGAFSFLVACAFPPWVLHPLHQVVAGAALGAALAGLELRTGLLPLGGAALCGAAGWLAGSGLAQNLAFAELRGVLMLAPALLWWRARRADRL